MECIRFRPATIASQTPKWTNQRTGKHLSRSKLQQSAVKKTSDFGWASCRHLTERDALLTPETNVEVGVGKYTHKKAVVVGAGPAGAVAAGFLSRLGFDVQVFEKRPDPNLVQEPVHRSNLLLLRSRTIDALRELGVEPPTEPGEYHNGMQMYLGTVINQPWKPMIIASQMDPERPGFQAERSEITKAILSTLRKNPNCPIQFNFNSSCTGVDFDNRRVTFEDRDGSSVTEKFDLLIAADGVRSLIRTELDKVDDELHVEVFESSRGYKTIRNLTPLGEEDPVGRLVKCGWYVLIPAKNTPYSSKQSPKPHLSLYKHAQGAVHGMLVATLDFFDEIQGQEGKWANCALPANFPKIWREEIGQKLQESPKTQISAVQLLSKLSGPRTVLLGDAGHSVNPNLSIGANMAITDSKALERALKEADGDLDLVSEIFNEQRISEIQHHQNLQLTFAAVGLDTPWTYRVLGFIGKVHSIFLTLGHLGLPKLIPMQLPHRFQYERITAEEALSLLKRDLLLFSTLLVAVMAVVVKHFFMAST